MRLYDFGVYVFAVERPDYIDAWGIHKVVGTLFDVLDGTVQVGAMLSCNIPLSSERALVAGAAAHHFGLELHNVLEV